MKRTALVTGFGMAAVLSVLYLAAPKAEEVPHHGFTVDSEGSVEDCMNCHDGRVSTNVSLNTMVGKYFGNHPVNRDYPPVGNSDTYVPVELVVSAGIKLVAGQITCISCHNLKNQERYHLAVTLDKSNLCYNCHRI
jgi:doubled CXXCH motif protein